MAFERFSYSKSWENPADFPTYEPDENKVRADLQCLHDEAAAAINGLIEQLNEPGAAGQLPIRPIEGLTAENLQQAVEQIYAAVQQAAAALIVDGSVTKEKLEKELLARIYGGKVWVSMNEPDQTQNPDTDFPVGQLWLRPEFVISNLAQEEWEVLGGTAVQEEDSWYFTSDGSRDYLTASQLLQSVGKPGEQIMVHMQAEQNGGQMSLFLNGMEYDLDEEVFEAQLDRTGSLEIMLRGQWEEAAAGEVLELRCLTAVNTDALQQPGWEACSDWAALLKLLGSFAEVTMPQLLWVQSSAGCWQKVARQPEVVQKGALLYGAGTDRMETLPPENGGILQMEGSKPKWVLPDELAKKAGYLQITEGTYEGTGGNGDRVLTLPVAPKVLYIYPEDGSYDTVALVDGGRSSDTYSFHDGNLVVSYLAQVRLTGNVLRFSNERRGNYAGQMLSQHMNVAGVTYRYVAVE